MPDSLTPGAGLLEVEILTVWDNTAHVRFSFAPSGEGNAIVPISAVKNLSYYSATDTAIEDLRQTVDEGNQG